MIRLDPADVLAARDGNRAALESIVRAAERPIFNLAIRMLANRADAEDATQEILIKVVTHLGSVREVEAAGAWALKIACRHLIQERKRGRVEAMRLTFEAFAEDLDRGLEPVSVPALSEIETALAVEEIKIGCTLAMLTCLTRVLRISYLLGDVFELTDTEAANVLEISPAAYRQRLKRARDSVTAFVGAHCGIASNHASCRCDKRMGAAIQLGRVTPGRSDFGIESHERIDLSALQRRVKRLEEGRRSAALMRSNPDFSTTVGALVLSLTDIDETR